MSSTNRKNVHSDNYYVTPLAPIREMLAHAKAIGIEGIDTCKLALDPCAGGDPRRPTMPYPHVLAEHGIPCATIDIRQDSSAQFKGDFLHYHKPPDLDFGLAITNPPFPLATQIVAHALKHWVDPGGLVIVLQRMNWLGSRKRIAFFREFRPTNMIVHPVRMSFGLDGKTDSIEYAHFVFREGVCPQAIQTTLVTDEI